MSGKPALNASKISLPPRIAHRPRVRIRQVLSVDMPREVLIWQSILVRLG
jgi:hypothetical protein